MEVARRTEILERYDRHVRRFESTRRTHSMVDSGHLFPIEQSSTLSEREREVLSLMADGLTDTEIGRQLYLAPFTVKSHAKKLFAKLGATGRAHAVGIGFRKGFLT